MTIAMGIKCGADIVLCADRQITCLEDGYKYPEVKLDAIPGGDWLVGLAYSGYPNLRKEAVEKIGVKLNAYIGKALSASCVYEITSEVLASMGDLTLEHHWVHFLVAVWNEREGAKLLKFLGRDVLPAEDFECLGAGDTSLIRFLRDKCLPSHPDLDLGVGVGSYFIKKAKDFVHGCGGQTDILVVRGPDPYWVKADAICRIERDIDDAEAKMFACFARDKLVCVDW